MEPWSERITFRAALLVCLLLLVAGGWGRWSPRPWPVTVERPELRVQINGAVARPGSYLLPWGSRVEDLVAMAGGLSTAADPHLVNLSRPLSDGAAVVVPGRVDPTGQARVDLNHASERQLMELPGVGPVMARRIVEARPFHRIEDLLRVPGIGPVRWEALEDLLTLGGG